MWRCVVPRVVSLMLLLWASALASCAVGEVGEPRPHIDGNACYESFHNAVEGWERFVGPLPEKCQRMDEKFEIVISDHMPCTGDVSGKVIGCTGPGWFITIRAGIGETKMANTSVHEWLHALEYCMYGDDANNEHADTRVWGEHPHDQTQVLDPTNAKDFGIATSAIGPCL